VQAKKDDKEMAEWKTLMRKLLTSGEAEREEHKREE